MKHTILKSSLINTPLGAMLAITDDESLYFLEFVDRRGGGKEVERFEKKTNRSIIQGSSAPAKQIEMELKEYFSGKIQSFKTPLFLIGSPFQKSVWGKLQKIPIGKTLSYAEIAKSIGKPTAFRAVALANSANRIAIVIPCHRVINSNGTLGGYSGGIEKKDWLLQHERLSI